MSIIARQSTARTVTVGPVLDADGVAVTDGVVGDFKISKNGGAPAALNVSATLTHRHTGHYSLALTTSDLDTVGSAEIVIDDTVNACPMKVITVIEEAVYDAFFAASAVLTVGALATQAKADVNAEVLDVLNVDTFAEIGQEAPAATQTIRKMLAFLYKAWRNRKTQTASQFSLYADDGTTVDQKSTTSDDGTEFISGEMASGP
jgi:hypothetical protein